MFKLSLTALLVICCLSLGCKPGTSPSNPQSEGSGDQAKTDPETADSDPAGPHRQIVKMQADFEQMTARLQLAGTELEALTAAHDTNLAALDSFYRENMPEMKRIRGEAIEAGKRRDGAKLNRMKARGDNQRIADLTNQERNLLRQYQTSLYQALSAEKLNEWKAVVVADQLLEFLAPLNLSEAQVAKVHELAPNAVAQHARETNWSGYGTATLEKMFGRQVVTPEQKADFEALKDRHKLRMMTWNNF